MLAVQWDFGEQRKQAIELLRVWPRLSSAERILELLTQPFTGFPMCRLYAVSRLRDVSDEVSRSAFSLLVFFYNLSCDFL